MIKRGLPALVITTERFNEVAKATLRSQRVPESVVIEIKGNPEFISDTDLFQVSQDVVERIARRFESGHALDRP